MPIDPRPHARPASSEPACRAVVAARLFAADRADALLRYLRVRVMQAGLLDDPALIAGAAQDAGLDPAELADWSQREEAVAALEADARAARSPSPAAVALDHKLGGPPEARRYTAPSYVVGGFVIPGFNPVEVYETAIANCDPGLVRRSAPSDLSQLLSWADAPLATVEVALIMGVSTETARDDLRAIADFHPAGADGYWTLRC
jgi:hypothetical protein